MTLSSSSGLTYRLLLSTLETVAVETPALSATSRILIFVLNDIKDPPVNVCVNDYTPI